MVAPRLMMGTRKAPDVPRWRVNPLECVLWGVEIRACSSLAIPICYNFRIYLRLASFAALDRLMKLYTTPITRLSVYFWFSTSQVLGGIISMDPGKDGLARFIH